MVSAHIQIFTSEHLFQRVALLQLPSQKSSRVVSHNSSNASLRLQNTFVCYDDHCVRLSNHRVINSCHVLAVRHDWLHVAPWPIIACCISQCVWCYWEGGTRSQPHGTTLECVTQTAQSCFQSLPSGYSLYCNTMNETSGKLLQDTLNCKQSQLWHFILCFYLWRFYTFLMLGKANKKSVKKEVNPET